MKMHNMTIRTEILREHQIRIDEHCYYVDTEYILYPIPYVKTICFVDAFVYYYRLGREGQSVGLEKMQKNEAFISSWGSGCPVRTSKSVTLPD